MGDLDSSHVAVYRLTASQETDSLWRIWECYDHLSLGSLIFTTCCLRMCIGRYHLSYQQIHGGITSRRGFRGKALRHSTPQSQKMRTQLHDGEQSGPCQFFQSMSKYHECCSISHLLHGCEKFVLLFRTVLLDPSSPSIWCFRNYSSCLLTSVLQLKQMDLLEGI